jgi:ubiquinone/menaquinone biosynthesis C-methylase UbiE
MIFKGIEICCPHCKGDLSKSKAAGDSFRCLCCGRSFPVILDIPDLRVFPDPYIELEPDRAKGLRVAARLHELGFTELVDFYYSITPVVPPRHAEQYKSGLRGAVARARAALDSWESVVGTNGRVRARSILDLGCGTAPLLVTAASRFRKMVGVDIAFRWLVVAKKRLADAGLDVPLICACAEALPFPDGVFDRVVADSVLEHLQDQGQGLSECYRVMRSGGYFFVSTPNKYSLGPDPHAGIWCGGFLPDSWIAAYVSRQGGIPPKRSLLSARSLSRAIKKAGFRPRQIRLPDVPAGQSTHFGKRMRLLIDLYHVAKQLPVSRELLHWVGPLFHCIAQKREGSMVEKESSPFAKPKEQAI